ncbi:MAG: hypothetical protein ACREO8_09725 [Luteimonas sp.]
MPANATPSTPIFALSLLLVGSLGIAAAWILFAYASDAQSSWIAVIAAFDAAMLLRLGRMRPGWPRALAGTAGTALAIVIANWGIAGGQMGKAVGLLPWEAMLRIGPTHAWTLIGLANPLPQLAWLIAALVIAAVAAR